MIREHLRSSIEETSTGSVRKRRHSTHEVSSGVYCSPKRCRNSMLEAGTDRWRRGNAHVVWRGWFYWHR